MVCINLQPDSFWHPAIVSKFRSFFPKVLTWEISETLADGPNLIKKVRTIMLEFSWVSAIRMVDLRIWKQLGGIYCINFCCSTNRSYLVIIYQSWGFLCFCCTDFEIWTLVDIRQRMQWLSALMPRTKSGLCFWEQTDRIWYLLHDSRKEEGTLWNEWMNEWHSFSLVDDAPTPLPFQKGILQCRHLVPTRALL